MLNKDVLLGIFRHVLTIIGGYLVAAGKIDADSTNTLIGGLTAIAGVGLSIKHKLD